MSQNDLGNVESSEEQFAASASSGQAEDVLDNGQSNRLVPVAESIRYRKRAQSAEKNAELLSEKLTEADNKTNRLSEELAEVRKEQTLLKKLNAAGAVDLDAALVLAKAKADEDGESDIDRIVEQLRQEKRYLFSQSASAVTADKTAGARDRSGGNHSVIIKAAQKAATSGSRRDLQEYLKLRRTLL